MVTKQAVFKGRDYITTQEWTDPEIETLLEVSRDLKRKFKSRIPHRYLPDQTIFLIFSTSPRVRGIPSRPGLRNWEATAPAVVVAVMCTV